jgi:hypothetical protein
MLVDETHIDRLRTSMRGAIDFARRRQTARMLTGKPVAEVTLTLDEAMSVLRKQGYRCALTRLAFYSLGGGSYGPSRPSLDRIKHAGPYSRSNVRVIFIGVNGLRGTSTDADMYVIARALVANSPPLR